MAVVGRLCRRAAVPLALSCLLLAGTACAQESWPARPLTLVVPFAAGGGTELQARFWAEVLQRDLAQSIVIDIKAGAGGSIGTRFAARSAPNGYTFVIATPSFTLTQFTLKEPGFHPIRDFAPVVVAGVSPLIVTVGAKSPINHLRELIERARARPGELTVGNAGTGSVGHMGAAKFQNEVGIRFTEVSYKGAGPAFVDLIGGRTDVNFDGIAAVVGHIKSGRVKPIAITSRLRSAILPGVPTASESGAPGFESYSWVGFLFPAGTPRSIVDKLNGVFRKALADPQVVKQMAESFVTEPLSGSPEDAAAFIAARLADDEKVARAIGMQPQ